MGCRSPVANCGPRLPPKRSAPVAGRDDAPGVLAIAGGEPLATAAPPATIRVASLMIYFVVRFMRGVQRQPDAAIRPAWGGAPFFSAAAVRPDAIQLEGCTQASPRAAQSAPAAAAGAPEGRVVGLTTTTWHLAWWLQ